MPRPRRRLSSSRRTGVTTVELAITVPILFTVLFTALEFSRMNVVRHTAVNAAYEGARRGIVPGSSATDVQDVAQAVLDTVGTSGATITVTPAVITPQTTEVTVTVNIPIGQNGWIAPHFFAGQNVTTSCTLKRELVETVVVP